MAQKHNSGKGVDTGEVKTRFLCLDILKPLIYYSLRLSCDFCAVRKAIIIFPSTDSTSSETRLELDSIFGTSPSPPALDHSSLKPREPYPVSNSHSPRSQQVTRQFPDPNSTVVKSVCSPSSAAQLDSTSMKDIPEVKIFTSQMIYNHFL